MTSLDAAEGTAEVSIADVGALANANADSASAKPKHADLIVLIKTPPPVPSLGLVRTIMHSAVNVFHGLRHLQGQFARPSEAAVGAGGNGGDGKRRRGGPSPWYHLQILNV